MGLLPRIVFCVVFASSVGIPYVSAQENPSERHVTEIKAESKAKYPYGYADTKLCRWAKAEGRPYARLRLVHADLATFVPSLTELMEKSEEVVLVGVALRIVTVLSPSEENAVSYTDYRVLHTWKGSHKVGDLITVGALLGFIQCGPAREQFSGTTPLFEGDAQFHVVNPVYSPPGPLVLFLAHDKTGEITAYQLAGGNGFQGSFELKPSDILDTKSPSSSCSRASLDQIGCHAFPHYPQLAPAFCRDEQIDKANIAQCNAVLNSTKEPMTERGYENDPLRQIYGGNPVANFLKDVQTVAGTAQQSASTLHEEK